jgi:hypothetical protein
MPGGDSIGRSGWDGITHATSGCPWVPVGTAYWEVSCEEGIRSKANEDFNNRTRETNSDIQVEAAFIFVTPRRWARKDVWVREKQAVGNWREVHAYDADDLEQWLEQAPEIALWFGEILGLHGPGVQSLERLWSTWSEQTRRPVTAGAILAGREQVRDQLLKRLAGDDGPITLRADSVEEAAAFAAAIQLGTPNQALVVTDPDGWRYVAANPAVTIAISTRPEHALAPVKRAGLKIIIPVALGAPLRISSTEGDDESDLLVDRPLPGPFEQALRELGHDPADAQRLERSTGRSWTIYRRIEARNPAIAMPGWITHPAARVLTTLCLVGSWSADKPADQAVVGQIAGHSYEEIERDLLDLASLDDSPLIRIGEVWQAKSPLELMQLYGPRLTGQELDRYFDLLREILSAPDPVLDLPEEQRYAAGIYGKLRAQSGRLIGNLTDSLIKLAVLGERIPALRPANLPARVSRIVQDLLGEADEIRWLSLAGLLRELAEAAPTAFLVAVERSLDQPTQPVTRLVRETTSAGLFGRCWHAGLLWALEILAWDPRHLTRVALILARLAVIEIKGNWSNTPLRSLASLFRSWLPQTAAPIERRIATLDRVIAHDPDIGWKLLAAVTFHASRIAHQNARPKWRDDDSGAGHRVPNAEVRPMIAAATERLLDLAKAHLAHLSELLPHLHWFDEPRRQRIWSMFEACAVVSMADEDKLILCKGLRTFLYRRSFSTEEGTADGERAETLLRALQPRHPILRHCWLFEAFWIDLPEPRARNHGARAERVEELRGAAIQEILNSGGFADLDRLINGSAVPQTIGLTLASLMLPDVDVVGWMLSHADDWLSPQPMSAALAAFLHALTPERHEAVVRQALIRLPRPEETPHQLELLLLCPCDRTTWAMVMAAGDTMPSLYWARARPLGHYRDPEELAEVVANLLVARRPRSAFGALRLTTETVDAAQLLALLDGICRGEESEGSWPDGWNLGKALDQIESAGIATRQKLATIEFALFPLVLDSERKAKALMHELASNPAAFIELVCLTSHKAQSPPGHAFEVLMHCTRVPGTRDDETLDEAVLEAWLLEVRRLSAIADCTTLAEHWIGQFFAHSPVGADGVWPSEAVRTILECHGTECLLDSFVTGTINKRGVTTRGMLDGGNQERDLAIRFQADAEALAVSHPVVAAALDRLGRIYVHDARQEDLEARLRIEHS